MKRAPLLIVSVALLMQSQLYSLAFCAESAPSEDKLATAIQSAAILPAGYRVSVQQTGKEAVVSTWRAPEADLTDCKIDAALIAKVLMVDKDNGLSRARVQFHEPLGTSEVFQEVVVTLAEVKGFASGTVTKEEFLSSLDVQKLPEKRPEPVIKPAVPEPTEDATTKEETGTKDGKPGTKPETAKVKPKPASVRFLSRRTGMSFSLPLGWTMQELATGDTVLRLTANQTKEPNIQLRFQPNMGSPAQRVNAMRQQFNYRGVTLERSLPKTNFGIGPYPGGLIVLTYPNWDNGGTPYYEMHLYFGSYDLWGWGSVTNHGTVGPAFDQIVRSLSFAKAPGK